MNTPIIQKDEFGTNYVGKPRRIDGGGWERIDTWIDDKDKSEHLERRFAAGPDDFSPMAMKMYAGHGNCEYHPKCPDCWLGFSHTLELHKRMAVGDWD